MEQRLVDEARAAADRHRRRPIASRRRLTPELLAARRPEPAATPAARASGWTPRRSATTPWPSAGLLSLEAGRPAGPAVPARRAVDKVGGAGGRIPTVSRGEDRYRRGLYVVWKRARPVPELRELRRHRPLACTVKRSRSNTPLQALTLLNDPVYVEAALAFARRVADRAAGATVDEAASVRLPPVPGPAADAGRPRAGAAVREGRAARLRRRPGRGEDAARRLRPAEGSTRPSSRPGTKWRRCC